jgi:hypothetical protein
LVAVLTISGGTALMITAPATRLSPWRQVVHHFAAAGRIAYMHRTLRSRCAVSVAGSSA